MQFSFKHLSLIVDNQNAGWSFIRCSFIGWSVICRKVDPPSIHDCNRCNFGGEHLLKIQIQIQIQIATVATLVGSISRLLPNRFHPSTIYPASTTYQINIDITYRKTEGIQSYLRIWGTYDPIESGPSEPKKWAFHRCSVKKCRILGRKCSFLAQNPFFCQKRPTFLLPSWPDNKKTSFLCWPRCTAGLGAAAGARFWPENLHFFYDSLPVTALALSARGMNKIEQKIGKPCSF